MEKASRTALVERLGVPFETQRSKMTGKSSFRGYDHPGTKPNGNSFPEGGGSRRGGFRPPADGRSDDDPRVRGGQSGLSLGACEGLSNPKLSFVAGQACFALKCLAGCHTRTMLAARPFNKAF